MKTGIFFATIHPGLPHRQAEQQAVARILADEFPGVPTGRHPSGLPWIEGAYISIAHCRDTAVVAVSDTPVGIDIEYPRPQLARVATRFLSPAEQQAYTTPAQLLSAWTAKEAAYKAIHSLLGTSCPVKVITDITLTPSSDLQPSSDGQASLDITLNTPSHATVAAHTFTLTYQPLPSGALLTIARPAN